MNAASGAGASRRSEVSEAERAALNAGTASARTLTEALVVDHGALLAAAWPERPDRVAAAVAAGAELGVLKRMRLLGEQLSEHADAETRARLAAHPSDTVRGWAAFAVGADSARPPAQRLLAIRGFADDAAFTVREWAWMAVRPALVCDLDESVAGLAAWTGEPSERLRRFASESLRPRGVWAAHIREFKQDPELGLPLLEPLRADESRSVQDSVANWINDAAKDQPDWARAVTARWAAASDSAATRRIVTRALRSL